METNLKASKRVEQGTGASRRLRRGGQTPGVIYGANKDAIAVTFDHNELYHSLRKDAFHSSVLALAVDGAKESVVLRDVQWHPFKQQVLHVDFMRVSATEKLTMKVPLHFINGDNSPAVKLAGCMISQIVNEIDISCLPKDLPEFIEVDLGAMQEGESIHLSQVTIPDGVEVVHHGEGDPVVATVLKVGGEEEADGEEGEAAAE